MYPVFNLKWQFTTWWSANLKFMFLKRHFIGNQVFMESISTVIFIWCLTLFKTAYRIIWEGGHHFIHAVISIFMQVWLFGAIFFINWFSFILNVFPYSLARQSWFLFKEKFVWSVFAGISPLPLFVHRHIQIWSRTTISIQKSEKKMYLIYYLSLSFIHQGIFWYSNMFFFHNWILDMSTFLLST